MTGHGKAFELKGVSLAYTSGRALFRRRRIPVLNNVTFDVQYGETLAIMGRNGIGKSTLLRLMAGVTLPDSGEIIRHVRHVSLQALNVGFDNELSGRYNALLSIMLRGFTHAEAMRMLPEIIDYSDLGERIDFPLKSYSNGMKSRLGFSISTHLPTDVLLIDETLSVGDERFRAKSSKRIREMVASDKTCVLVTHNLGFIKKFCDRVVWLENGQVHMVGDPKVVVDAYREDAGTNLDADADEDGDDDE